MKKTILTILILSLFFAIVGFAHAKIDTIVDYPELEGATKPGEATEGKELPEFIKYIFTFALGIVGILGLLAIIFGAFTYLTAVGNPQQAAKAKDTILSALLGILLLLGSYLLLNIINPNLLKWGVELETDGGTENGQEEESKDYACYYCCSYSSCNPITDGGSATFCKNTTEDQASTSCKKEAEERCSIAMPGTTPFSEIRQESCD